VLLALVFSGVFGLAGTLSLPPQDFLEAVIQGGRWIPRVRFLFLSRIYTAKRGIYTPRRTAN
jgi:hypothetical protein